MKHLIAFLCLLGSTSFAEEIEPSDVPALGPSDVVFLGELHDNPWHHENQAAIIAKLAPRAIVFEMLTPEKAGQITPELLSDEKALSKALDWENSGWPDFAMYFPIFAAASDAAIYGAQVRRDAVRAAIMGGDVVASFGEGAADYGLTEPLDPAEQADREALQMEAHCNALPESMLPGMVLGQRLRDAVMAREIERAYAETGGPVVVITGNGHARLDWGAPRLMTKVLSVVSVAQLESAPEDEVPYDYWIVTPEADREDPCLAFTKS